MPGTRASDYEGLRARRVFHAGDEVYFAAQPRRDDAQDRATSLTMFTMLLNKLCSVPF
jgi:hypothetical protein